MWGRAAINEMLLKVLLKQRIKSNLLLIPSRHSGKREAEYDPFSLPWQNAESCLQQKNDAITSFEEKNNQVMSSMKQMEER